MQYELNEEDGTLCEQKIPQKIGVENIAIIGGIYFRCHYMGYNNLNIEFSDHNVRAINDFMVGREPVALDFNGMEFIIMIEYTSITMSNSEMSIIVNFREMSTVTNRFDTPTISEPWSW